MRENKRLFLFTQFWMVANIASAELTCYNPIYNITIRYFPQSDQVLQTSPFGPHSDDNRNICHSTIYASQKIVSIHMPDSKEVNFFQNFFNVTQNLPEGHEECEFLLGYRNTDGTNRYHEHAKSQFFVTIGEGKICQLKNSFNFFITDDSLSQEGIDSASFINRNILAEHDERCSIEGVSFAFDTAMPHGRTEPRKLDLTRSSINSLISSIDSNLWQMTREDFDFDLFFKYLLDSYINNKLPIKENDYLLYDILSRSCDKLLDPLQFIMQNLMDEGEPIKNSEIISLIQNSGFKDRQNLTPLLSTEHEKSATKSLSR